MAPKLVGIRRADGKYKGKHEVEIFDVKKDSRLECACGMIIECANSIAESIADNHEQNFNNPPEF